MDIATSFIAGAIFAVSMAKAVLTRRVASMWDAFSARVLSRAISPLSPASAPQRVIDTSRSNAFCGDCARANFFACAKLPSAVKLSMTVFEASDAASNFSAALALRNAAIFLSEGRVILARFARLSA